MTWLRQTCGDNAEIMVPSNVGSNTDEAMRRAVTSIRFGGVRPAPLAVNYPEIFRADRGAEGPAFERLARDQGEADGCLLAAVPINQQSYFEAPTLSVSFNGNAYAIVLPNAIPGHVRENWHAMLSHLQNDPNFREELRNQSIDIQFDFPDP